VPDEALPWFRRRWVLGTGAVVLAGTATGVALWASSASGVTGYRTAVATTATVRQELGVSGTVDPVQQANVAFQVAGTVADVDVAAGQKVKAGQTLATLDTAPLQQDVSSAELALSAAQSKLSEDESGQSSSSTSSSTGSPIRTTADVTPTTTTPAPTGGTGGSGGTGGTGTGAGGSGTGGTSLQQAQQAVVDAQHTADADAQAAAAALAAAQTACAGSGSPTESTTTTTTAPTTTTTTPTGGTSCAQGLSRALAAQQQLATDQKAVADAEGALASLLESEAATGTGSGGSSASGGRSSSGSTSGSKANGGGSNLGGAGSSNASDSAAQLATDQASIDSAEATLIEAQQSLADAQLVSPLAGTVASVGLSAGMSVAPGSTGDAITVIDSGGYEVDASLTTAQDQQVKVGDSALVSVDGLEGTLRGTVTRTGPATSSSSGYSFPLVVALPKGSHGIAAGSSAQVQVVLRQVSGALAVPTSAVNTLGVGRSYVLVLVGGREERRFVTVGVVGPEYTQITRGLTRGTTVVLADLGAPVPASSTNGLRGFGGLGRFAGLGDGSFGGSFGGPGAFKVQIAGGSGPTGR
jgi:HlyD family secretion protein